MTTTPASISPTSLPSLLPGSVSPATSGQPPDDDPARPDLPYHRLALAHPRHRWWRPLLQLLVFATLTMVLALLLMGTLDLLRLVPALSGPLGTASTGSDLNDPVTMGLLLTSVAVTLPAALLTQRICAPPSARLLSSVAGRLRRPMLARSLGLAALALTPATVVAAIAGRDTLQVDTRSVVLVLVVLALVPFQAAAEEYVFRGMGQQLLGAWVRHPAFAILVPVPLFVVGHGYGPFGSLEIATFALVTGWLTWRTGGLEAAIGLHVVNNVVIMSLGAIGLVDLNATETSAPALALNTATMAAYTWLVLRPASSRVATSALR